MKLSIKFAIIVFCSSTISIVWSSFLLLPAIDTVAKNTFPYVSDVIFTLIKLAVLFILSVVPTSILVWVIIVRKIIKPVLTLNRLSSVIARGNFSKIEGIETDDEIGELSKNINLIIKNLLKALQSMADSLKESKQKSQELALNIEALTEAKAKDEALLSSIGEGVIAISYTGRIIFINSPAGMMLGYVASEVIGKLWKEVIPTIEQIDGKNRITENQPIDEVFRTSQRVNFIATCARNDGSTFVAQVNASPILIYNQVNGVIVTFRDVTREREADRMKTEFISLASHQLRTPLSAIRWFTELLMDGTTGELSAQQREMADNISQSTDRMIDLVNSLLNISRIESGRIIVDPQPTDLVKMVKGLINELQVKISEKNQKLVVSVHENLPMINVDPKLIRQVYLNLLTNAIKYTPKNGQIMVFISKRGDEVISQVSDNGYGIPRNETNKVFQKFFRGDNIVKIETDGTGLGLYLVRTIIESSHGKIWFESEESRGTTFWFSLPLSGMVAQKGEVTLDS